jgi:hypothetical protein
VGSAGSYNGIGYECFRNFKSQPNKMDFKEALDKDERTIFVNTFKNHFTVHQLGI